jgi:lipopolysaccharide/colanic/teichoic acid biosynthesis glycosyltransferase
VSVTIQQKQQRKNRSLRSRAQDASFGTRGLPIATLSRWPDSRAKRMFDLIAALLLLVPALPLMAIVAIAIKLTSPGPVLFQQLRCGKNGWQFHLLKFRSMWHARSQIGPGLTCSNDARVTRVGRVIRKWKLDELPQLFNVVRGEMSLVGPRPDLPEYLGALPAAQQQVLHLKPGVTSLATLRFRHEEELLRTVPAETLTAYYIESILPQKIRIELDYACRASLFSDVAVLLRTVRDLSQ